MSTVLPTSTTSACSRRHGRANLRSAESHDMLVPSTRTQLSRRSFNVAAPAVWNALPSQLRSSSISRGQFRGVENPSLHTGLRTCENTFVEEHIITRHSFVRAKGEVFVLLYVFFCLFAFLLTISRQPAGRFTPNFACGRTLVPDVSSPLLGVSGPRGAEKGGNETFVTIGVNGEFLHFGGFERYLSNA